MSAPRLKCTLGVAPFALAFLFACIGDTPIALPPGADGGLDATTPDGASETGSDAGTDSGAPRTGKFKWLFQLPNVGQFAMAVGPDGSVTAASVFGSPIKLNGQTLTPHSGGSDILVVQLDPAGKVKWFKTFGVDTLEMKVNGLGLSGNMVVVAGAFVPQDQNTLSWSPTPFHKLTSSNGGNDGPFLLGLDGSQSGTPTWARSVVAANLGEGDCWSVSPGVVGTVAVGCSVTAGKISVTTFDNTFTADAASTGSAVVAVIRVSDGSANDLEVIDGLTTVGAGLDASGVAYVTGVATASPLKFRRGNTTSAFDASKPNNVVAQLQGGGGAKWSRFWPRGQFDDGLARLAFDGKKNAWATLPFTGTTNPGSGVLTAQGLHDWSVVELAPLDGTVVAQTSYGGGAEDEPFGIAFDDGDLLLFGEGKDFAIGSLAVPSAPGQATKLVLAKLAQTSLTQGVWLDTATEGNRSAAWSSSSVGVGGGMDVIGGILSTQLELTPTDVANGSPQVPVMFIAAFDR